MNNKKLIQKMSCISFPNFTYKTNPQGELTKHMAIGGLVCFLLINGLYPTSCLIIINKCWITFPSTKAVLYYSDINFFGQ